jgi:PAS domain S-box-containing protein
LVQTVNSIILVLTPEGEVQFANQFACDFFGYTAEELIGSSVFNNIVPQYDQSGQDLFTRLSQGLKNPEQIESNIHENLRRDGTRVWIAWRNQAIRDAQGNLVEVLAVGNDITERKKESEAIRHSEETLRNTMGSALQPVLITELRTGRLLETNEQFEAIFGYTAEETRELTLTDLICETSECTHQKVQQILKRAGASQKEGKFYSVFECLCKRKNGETYWAEVTISYLDQDSKSRNLCIVYDITDRKKSEERLLLQRNRLADLLQAQERERRLIAYEIHDGPAQRLAAASMQLEVCHQMLDKDRHVVERTLAEGRELLSQALLEIRRLIAGLRPPQLDDAGVIAAIQTLTQESPKKPQVRFSCDVRFKRLEPLAENSLFRIVQESLTNATRYSQSETVEVRLVQADGHIRLEVQDEGVGFEPGKVQSDRFGLNGIRERASVLGGHAVIRSSPGFGTRITVELPASLIVE